MGTSQEARMRKLTIRISEATFALLQALATEQDIPLAQVVRDRLGDTVVRPGHTTFSITQGSDLGTKFNLANEIIPPGKETI
jgi:hypothetical protein